MADDADALDAILDGADTRDQKLWAVLALLEDTLSLPADARVGQDRVLLTHVDYGGDALQGLSAEVSRGERRMTVPLTAVEPLRRIAGSSLIRRYQAWFRGRAPGPAAGPVGGPSLTGASPTNEVTLVVMALSGPTARCLQLPDRVPVVYRVDPHRRPAPGATLTIAPSAAVTPLSGPIVGVRVDAAALGLQPPGLVCVRAGEPPIYRMATGSTPEGLDEAQGLADAGDPEGARRLIEALLAEELGLIAGHRALGDLALASDAFAAALVHYAVGAAIGDLVVPEDLDGLLPGDDPANRPYLGCLEGCVRALTRLGRRGDAVAPRDRLLALDPDDHFGVGGR